MTLFEKIVVVIVGVAFFVGMLALSFAIVSAIIYGICWAFKLTFAWRYAFGVWLILLVMRSVLRGESK